MNEYKKNRFADKCKSHLKMLKKDLKKMIEKDRRLIHSLVYFVIRLLFIVALMIVLFIVKLMNLKTIHIIETIEINIELLYLSTAIVIFWSGVLFYAIRIGLKRFLLRPINVIIASSLFVDGFVIYTTSVATGNANSPFFHTVYFLIAFHSFYFPTYHDKLEKIFKKFRYIFGGGFFSILVAMTIYCKLTEVRLDNLKTYIILGLQVVTVLTFTALRVIEKKQYEIFIKQKRAQQKLTKSLKDVANIINIKDRDSLKKRLKLVCNDIGNYLSAEYCSIGICEDDIIEDVAFWTNYELSDKAQKVLAQHRYGNISDTLVGSILKMRKEIFYWDESKDGDILEKKNPNLIRLNLKIRIRSAQAYIDKILRSSKIKHMIIIPLYSFAQKGNPLGYIHIINRIVASDGKSLKLTKAGFREESRKIMAETIASPLAVALENFKIHQAVRASKKEEEFINSLSKLNDLDVILEKILKYLNEVIDSKVASLWLPTEDGFSSERNRIKLVLRSVVIGATDESTDSDKKLKDKICEKYNVFKKDDCFIGSLLNSLYYEPIYKDDISKEKDSWVELKDEIGTKRFIAIPIQRLTHKDLLKGKKEPWEGVLAILCLRPQSEFFRFNESIKKILKSFADHIGFYIEQVRFKHRYNQIETFRRELEDLHMVDVKLFYDQIVKIVKDVMGAEACSLFFFDKLNRTLKLKTTSAEQATMGNHSKEIIINTKDYINKKIYDLNKRSITGEILMGNEVTLIYDVRKNSFFSKDFLEKTRIGNHKSLIGAPIIDSKGDKIGVIRCINKEKKGVVLPVFFPSDKILMELITGIITRFIEYAKMNSERGDFLNRLYHEIITPLHAFKSQIDFLECIYKGTMYSKKPEDQFQYLRDQTDHFHKMFEDINIQFGMGELPKESYYYSKVNLFSIARRVQDLHRPFARDDRNITIQIISSKYVDHMYVDKLRFEQVLYNIVHNAVKYSKKGGMGVIIEFKGEVDRQFVKNRNNKWELIEIKNWGIGVLEEEKELIFQLYKRGSNIEEVAPEGTGIGLSVVKEIIKKHDCYAFVSNLNNPTIFSIYLPNYLKHRRPKK